MSILIKQTENDGREDYTQNLIDDLNTKFGLDGSARAPIGGTWQPIAATSGSDSACAVLCHLARIYVPLACLVTGIQYLVGSVGGTHKAIVTLYNESGTLLRASAAAGATVGTAAQVQQIAFALDGALAAATTLELEPGYYWIGVTFEGTTPKFRTVPAYCNVGTNLLAGSVAQTFGTIGTSVVVPTTFTADKAPVASLY